MQFAEILASIKEDRKLSNIKIAELAGVSEGAVRSWLDGSKSPGVAPFRLLCEGLGVDADYLLGRTANTTPPSKRLNIPDELRNARVAFHRGEFEGLEQGEVDKLAEFATFLKSQRKKQ